MPHAFGDLVSLGQREPVEVQVGAEGVAQEARAGPPSEQAVRDGDGPFGEALPRERLALGVLEQVCARMAIERLEDDLEELQGEDLHDRVAVLRCLELPHDELGLGGEDHVIRVPLDLLLARLRVEDTEGSEVGALGRDGAGVSDPNDDLAGPQGCVRVCLLFEGRQGPSPLVHRDVKFSACLELEGALLRLSLRDLSFSAATAL